MDWIKKSIIFLSCCFALQASLAQLNNPHTNNPAKTRYASFSSPIKTLDPAKSYGGELLFISQIYEPVLQYHYLKRPYTLVPLTATKLPSITYLDKNFQPISNNNKTAVYSRYLISLQPNIYYQPHPAFAHDNAHYLYLNMTSDQLADIETLKDFKKTGTKLLTSDDYIYEIKRLADPRLNSPIEGFMEKYIVGLKDLRHQLQKIVKEKKLAPEDDYFLDLRQFSLAGVQKIDDTHFTITIHSIYPQFMNWLAMDFFAPIPWQADKLYAQKGMKDKNITFDWQPVGTGPFMLTKNNPNKAIVLDKNPYFHKEYYPSEGEAGDQEKGLLTAAGQRLPLTDRYVFSLEKEAIPRWSKFLQGYYDRSDIGSDSFDQVIQLEDPKNPALTPLMQKRGLQLDTVIAPQLDYLGFNMNDPIVGGYTEKARALRQAISIAVDYNEFIQIFLNGRGFIANHPIPPGIAGSPNPQQINPYIDNKTLADAKKLMVIAGYPNGIDPKTGKPLILNFDTPGGSSGEEMALFNWMRKQFNKIGINLNIQATDRNRFQDKIRTGQTQLFTSGWSADYPDAENFLFLFYSKNGKVLYGGENISNYNNPAFDKLFEKMQPLEPGPERQALIDQMLALIEKDAPLHFGYYPIDFLLSQPWITSVKLSAMHSNNLKYQDTNPEKRHQLLEKWNQPVFWPLVSLFLLISSIIAPLIFYYHRKQNKPPLTRY